MLVSLVLYPYNGDERSRCAHRYLATVSRPGAHAVTTINQSVMAGMWFPRDLESTRPLMARDERVFRPD